MKKKIVLANDNVSINLPIIVELLNTISSFFIFELYEGSVQIEGNNISHNTYDRLNIEVDDKTNRLIIFTDKKYYNNYFYMPRGRICIVSFYAWEYLTKLPKNNGAVYFIADLFALSIDSSFRHTLEGSSNPECIYDFLKDKSGVDSSMRASYICSECNSRIRNLINSSDKKNAFQDTKNILNELGNASKWDDDLVLYWKKRMNKSSKKKAEKRKVFISYSHEDSKWLKRVKVHLKPLERDSIIEIWEDTRIQTGDNWKLEIEHALAESQAAILLVSADFLASDFIIENELPQLLKIAKEKGTRIFQIIISPCCFDETKHLSQFQAVNSSSNTLIEMSPGDQERLLLQLAKSIISHADTG